MSFKSSQLTIVQELRVGLIPSQMLRRSPRHWSPGSVFPSPLKDLGLICSFYLQSLQLSAD